MTEEVMTTSDATTEQAAGQSTGAPESPGSSAADDALGREFTSRGLTVAPATADPPSFEGRTLSAVGFAPPGVDGPARVAVAVLAGDGLEAFDLAVAAIQAANLDLTPATAVSISSLDELTATVDRPHELSAIHADGEIVGVVVRHADRRSAAGGLGDADPSTRLAPGPAGSTGMATGGNLAAAPSLGLLQDVMLEVTVELGRTALPLAQLMNLGIGSVVELDRNAGSPVDVRVNGTLFAKGEVVVVDGEYAVRIIEILAPAAH